MHLAPPRWNYVWMYRMWWGSQLEQHGSAVGRNRWSSLAPNSWNCVDYLCLSGVIQVLLSMYVSIQNFHFKFVFLICYQEFLLCTISCSVVTETPMWIFVSWHQCVVSSFNMCDQNITWSSPHCILLNLLVNIYIVNQVSSWGTEVLDIWHSEVQELVKFKIK